MNAIHVWITSLLPLSVAISAWGVIAGITAMGIYAITSNQAAISELKVETRNLRRKMMNPSLDDYTEFIALAKKNLKVSLTFLGKVIGPALLSAIPILLIVVWLGIYHSYALPEDQKTVSVTVFPVDPNIQIAPTELVYMNSDGNSVRPRHLGKVLLRSNERIVYSGNPFEPPVPVIAKRKWWNLFLKSEAGYLIPGAPFREIHLDFQRKLVLEGVPAWVAGWELIFFLSLTVTALAVKCIFRIH